MNAERREQSIFPIPEMPERKHLPTLVRLFNATGNPSVIELRKELYDALRDRKVKKADCDFIIQMTALSYWLHRKEQRITGGPYIIHPLEVAVDIAKDEFIPKKLLPRAIAGAVLHDAVENNPFVEHEKIAAVAGDDVANDVEVYSRKSASDIADNVDSRLNEADYLKRILKALPHVRRGKVRDRIRNIRSMPADADKMYDKYFRRDRDAFIVIINSLGNDGQKLYEDYRNAYNANKPADVDDLPPYDVIAA